MSEPKSNYGCQSPGCPKHVNRGDSIFRTSPKGGSFQGMCEEHFPKDQRIDPEVLQISHAIEGK